MALVPFPGAAAAHDPEPLDPDESGGKMSFLEHLDELRKRLIYICLSILGGCLVAFIFIQRVFDWHEDAAILIVQPDQELRKLEWRALSGKYRVLQTSGVEDAVRTLESFPPHEFTAP